MNELRYSPDHCWGFERGGLIVVGVTPLLIQKTSGPLRCHLPRVGTVLMVAKAFGSLESDKLTVDLFSPCEGVVERVNADVQADAIGLRSDPWRDGWLLEVKGRLPRLLSAAQYEERFGASRDGVER